MTAAEFNQRVRAAAQNQSLRGHIRAGSGAMRTQWTVTVERDVSYPGKIDYAANPLSGQAFFSASVFRQPLPVVTWRVTIGEGCVNQIPATIKGAKLSADPAPGLIVIAPSAGLASLGDFQRVPDPQRPSFFRTAEAWQSDLFRASVYVTGIRPFSADPLIDVAVLDLELLPDSPTLVGLLAGLATRETLASIAAPASLSLLALLPPYEVRVGSLPLILDGTENFRLAWLYLLRAPGADPAADQIAVQQLCYWNLAAFSVLEDAGLLALSQLIGATGDIGALTGLDIVSTLIDSTAIRWWTR